MPWILHHKFVTYISHLKYIGSLSCIDLPNVDTCNFTTSKKSSILAPVSSEKYLKLCSCRKTPKWWLAGSSEEESVSKWLREVCGHVWCVWGWLRDSYILQEPLGLADQALLDREPLLWPQPLPGRWSSGTETTVSWSREQWRLGAQPHQYPDCLRHQLEPM